MSVAHHMQEPHQMWLPQSMPASCNNTVKILKFSWVRSLIWRCLQGEQTSQGQAPRGHGNIEIPVKQGFVVQNPDGSVPGLSKHRAHLHL